MNLNGVTDADNCNERDAEADFASFGTAGIPPARTTLQFAPPAPHFWRHGSLSRAPNAACVHSSVRPSCNDVCQWSCASPYAPTPRCMASPQEPMSKVARIGVPNDGHGLTGL